MILRSTCPAVIAAFLILLPCSGWGENPRIDVKDGDSFAIRTSHGEKEVRLYGVDAPEWDQDFSEESKALLTRLLSRVELKIEPMDVDQFGRTVGVVTADGRCLNEEMVRAGLAWVFTRYCHEPICRQWYRLQEEAQAARRGLWSAKHPVPPWEYRREEKAESPGSKTGEKTVFSGLAPYHGNTSSRVFHKRDCDQYNCKRCTASFWTRDAALRAGYRPCKSCIP